ncbi:hypothetical protein [Streptomyces sp. NPDC005507]|uniref:hypothetical protein n=1 Tax=unclassified Streptomyces TaxID=2593676 RepID=UPI0033BB6AF4
MSENTMNIEQHVEGAARSLVELVNALEAGGLPYPLEVYRIYSYLTRVAGEMGTALDLVEASLQGLHEKGHLMSDYRGEPLDEVLQRFTQSSGQARGLAGALTATWARPSRRPGISRTTRHLPSRSRRQPRRAEPVCSTRGSVLRTG